MRTVRAHVLTKQPMAHPAVSAVIRAPCSLPGAGLSSIHSTGLKLCDPAPFKVNPTSFLVHAGLHNYSRKPA